MKQIDCDIIQDLLPIYIDKTSSDSTNKLVEEHLKNCNSCSNMLNEINKKYDSKKISAQEKQINYLKGFKKDKKMAVIKTILIFIIIFLVLFLSQFYISEFGEFYIDVDKLPIQYCGKQDSSTLLFNTKNNFFDIKYYEEYSEDKLYFTKSSSHLIFVHLKENTKQVYIQDKHGKLREIWNKHNGIITDKSSIIEFEE